MILMCPVPFTDGAIEPPAGCAEASLPAGEEYDEERDGE